MSDRTTSELIETLGDDVHRCHGELVVALDAGKIDANGEIHADYEYHVRQLVRAIFAFFEAVTFSAKVKAIEHGLSKRLNVPDVERLLAVDIEQVLSGKGEIVDRPAHIRLTDNIRFAFSLQEKVLQVKHFDPSKEWWSCLKSSIKVRDRLTHPKMPEDIDVSGDEIVTALKAYSGFTEQLMYYAKLRDGANRSKNSRGRTKKENKSRHLKSGIRQKKGRNSP